jgi:16S rRNA (cytosine967-C5)-methyltransferase
LPRNRTMLGARPCDRRDRLAAGRRRPAPAGPRRARHPCFARSPGRARHRTFPPRRAALGKAWGDEVVAAARRQIANRPPLDLSFASPTQRRRAYAECRPAARRSLRATSGSKPARCGASRFRRRRWWVQDLAASLPARLIPKDAKDRARRLRGAGRQDDAAGRRRPPGLALDRSRNGSSAWRRISSAPAWKPSSSCADALEWEPEAVRRESSRRALLGDRHVPPPSGSAVPRPAPHHRRSRRAQLKLLAAAADWVRPGRSLVYSVCSLEPEEGEGIVERLPHIDRRLPIGDLDGLPDFAASAREGWVRILPGLLKTKAGSTASLSRALSATASV